MRSRAHGSNGHRRRAFFYACTSHYNRGPEVCPHVEQWPMEAIDRAVLGAVAGDVLTPDLVEHVVMAAREQFDAAQRPTRHADRRRELEATEREQARLTEAIAAGADMPVLVARLRATEAKRRELKAAIENTRRPTAQPSWRDVERRIRQSLTDWRSLLTGDVAQARQGFRQLLTTPILLTPFVAGGRRGIRFEGRIGFAAVLGGEVVTKLASPTGGIPEWTREVPGEVPAASRSGKAA